LFARHTCGSLFVRALVSRPTLSSL
jgi:hypothetical protein